MKNNNGVGENACAERSDGDTPQEQFVIGNEGKALASGFDSLVLALSLTWKHDQFFQELRRLKADAVAQGVPMPGVINAGADAWLFNVKPHGSEGYAYLLSGHDYYVKLVESMSPRSRPSMVEIRSATLWQTGVVEAVDRILTLLNAAGAIVNKAMTSRVDASMDMLLPETMWTPEFMKHAVKRAKHEGLYRDAGVLCGGRIGKGDIQARLYDKPLEISTKSKKFWMYGIWGLQDVSPGCRVIRVEFQLRREVLKELGIDTVWDLVNHPRNLWAYCTQDWLKFQDHPELHHTQQKTLPWWKTVQNEFLGGQRACPLIRAKIVNANKVQISQQMLGQLTSLLAMDSDGDITPGGEITLEEQLSAVIEGAQLIGMTPEKCHERVRRKIAKCVQDVEKFLAAEKQRKALGLPVLRKPENENGGGE